MSNDTYGRDPDVSGAVTLEQPEGVHIPSRRAVYRVMDQIGLSHRPEKRIGLQRQTGEAMKSDDHVEAGFFHSNAPLEKCNTDITEIPAQWEAVSCDVHCFDLGTSVTVSRNRRERADLCIRRWKMPDCISRIGRSDHPR